MDILSADFIIQILALVLGFVLGLFKNKPGYQKGKNVLAALSKGLEDDVLTTEELRAIYDAVKKQAEPE